ncbi:MAG: multidrug ABC transporter ATP-binding protein [Chloroflexi bacterium HGW-Chloroflexi-8]|jgi:ABC-2 type transport system ATP-binding protein|nr:MAG: multidrug ABC transporter ATP-binding protein [Chloroflexi bacterium HGW-Chloroflexi-8]
MDKMVEVEGLSKTYGTTIAVDNLSFSVDKGEIFGMVGPNGAGKTTTMECLEGLRKPDRGFIRTLGVDPQQDSKFIKSRTGMQLQQSNLPERMKVWEALDLYSSFYAKPADWRDLLSQLGLEEKRNTAFSKLSGGQKQRLFIAMALLPDPDLIFLDELTTGLDPQARHAIWDLIRSVQSKGKTILLTTHFMEEAERLCDRVAILDHGQLVAMDTPSALVHSLGKEERIVFRTQNALPMAFEKAFSGTTRVEKQGETIIIHGNSDHSPLVVEVVNQLASQGIQFQDLHTEQATLEDVFLKLTGRQMRD